MLAWMDEEALRRTRETGEAWFWSRSRQESAQGCDVGQHDGDRGDPRRLRRRRDPAPRRSGRSRRTRAPSRASRRGSGASSPNAPRPGRRARTCRCSTRARCGGPEGGEEGVEAALAAWASPTSGSSRSPPTSGSTLRAARGTGARPGAVEEELRRRHAADPGRLWDSRPLGRLTLVYPRAAGASGAGWRRTSRRRSRRSSMQIRHRRRERTRARHRELSISSASGACSPSGADREEPVPLVGRLRRIDVERAEMLERGRREAGLLAQLACGGLRGRLALVDHAARQLQRDPAHALLPLAHEHDLPCRGDGDDERSSR